MSDLPAGWEWATLGDVAESVQNGVFVSRPSMTPNGVPILRISSVRAMQLDFRDLRYSGVDHESLASDGKLLESDDLLFTRYSGSREFVGACARVPDQVAPTTYPDKLIRARVRQIDSRYLEAAFASPMVRSLVEKALRTTAGQVGISGSALKAIRIPIAPIAEQRRIVATLEEHLARLDAGRRSLVAARWRLERLSDASRGSEIDAAEAPDGSLADVLTSIEAGRSFGGSARPAGDDEWGIVKVSAMTWGEFRQSENKAVSESSRIERRFEIKPGDVLVSRANTIDYVGAAVLVRNTRPKLLLSDKSLRLRPKPGVDPRWLVEILSSRRVRQQIAEKSTGNQESMRNISQAALLSIRIPLHDADQQSRLADVLADRRAALGRLDADLTKTRTAADGLRRSLLAEAFAGRLVPQDPSDEPASALLDRIRAEGAALPKPRRTRRPVAP